MEFDKIWIGAANLIILGIKSFFVIVEFDKLRIDAVNLDFFAVHDTWSVNTIKKTEIFWSSRV